MEDSIKISTGFFNLKQFIYCCDSVEIQKFRQTTGETFCQRKKITDQETKRQIAEVLYYCSLTVKYIRPLDFDLNQQNFEISLYLMGMEKLSVFIGKKHLVIFGNWHKAKTLKIRKLLEELLADSKEFSLADETRKIFARLDNGKEKRKPVEIPISYLTKKEFEEKVQDIRKKNN